MSEASKAWAYARVSSREQNLDRQLLALQQYVPNENIVVDKQSGKSLERAGYQALKGPLGLRPGDTLYIKSLDRLSRNKEDIRKELEWFRENDIRLMIIDLPTSMIQVPDGQSWIIDMINNILIEVLASMAEQERIEINARQKEGISAAMAKGVTFGRPRIAKPDNFDAIYEKVLKKEYTSKRAMTELCLTSYVFYNFAKEYRKEHGLV